ncbi:anti-sigma factor [Curvibacter sp. CHRR-16]|uniref:anti-sigma factor family protein n=1 Tax=Curvibacter sp. CHRR-16 TaxID=2835872 RepID=UPI001BDA9DB9|nr:anti-sigma factor [Curvibacter sp. CHRR-16]MBT0570134.1 anti-sigma factor [Curvibacter sp. CHRR-16]
MSTEYEPLDPITLHAFVDGQLGAAEATEVAQRLAAQPEQAAWVAQCKAHSTGLRALHTDYLQQGIPPSMLQRLHQQQQQRPLSWPLLALRAAWRQPAWVACCWLILGAAVGGGVSWWLHPTGAGFAAGFVRDAQIAHVVYQPEVRHPVEVSAEQQAHLVQWLSKRLGQPLQVPQWTGAGYSLVGGRLLPAGQSGAGTTSTTLTRAMFMYQHPNGQRVTLYVSVLPATPAASSASTSPDSGGAAFSLQESPLPSMAGAQGQTFYWQQGRMAYAVTGQIPSSELLQLAQWSYQQLLPEAGSTQARAADSKDR